MYVCVYVCMCVCVYVVWMSFVGLSSAAACCLQQQGGEKDWRWPLCFAGKRSLGGGCTVLLQSVDTGVERVTVAEVLAGLMAGLLRHVQIDRAEGC